MTSLGGRPNAVALGHSFRTTPVLSHFASLIELVHSTVAAPGRESWGASLTIRHNRQNVSPAIENKVNSAPKAGGTGSHDSKTYSDQKVQVISSRRPSPLALCG